MQITFKSGQTIEAVGVHGGKGQYQGAQREWLDFVIADRSADEMDALFTPSELEAVTLTKTTADPETGDPVTESYIHSGYVLRGHVHVTQGTDGSREVTVRQYQRTAMEDAVAELRAAQDAMMEGIV